MGSKSLVLGFICFALSPAVVAIEEQTNDEGKTQESRDRRERDNSKRDRDDDFSYSYIELSFIDHGIDLNGAGADSDGSKFELSLALGDSLFGILNRTNTDGNQFGAGFDFDIEGYGFGLRGDSWFASYTYNTWDLNNVEFDVDTIRLGFRNKWSEDFEFSASYTWNDFEGFDNENGFQVGLAYAISPSVDLVADYETLSGDFNLDTISLGIRLNF